MNESTIIHFTSSFANLKSILKSYSLRLFYSKEDFFLGNKKISSAAHPMVCFSEYKLANLSSKKISYGKYAICFSKEWARKNNISPVMYINKKSPAAKGLGRLLQARQNKLENSLPKELRLPIIQLKCFTKNEIGYNSYFGVSDFNFKAENEWRYVPDKKDIDNQLISQNKNKYLKNQKYYDDKLIPYPLKFLKDDIEVIYVSNKNEKYWLIKNLDSTIHNKIRIFTWKTLDPV